MDKDGLAKLVHLLNFRQNQAESVDTNGMALFCHHCPDAAAGKQADSIMTAVSTLAKTENASDDAVWLLLSQLLSGEFEIADGMTKDMYSKLKQAHDSNDHTEATALCFRAWVNDKKMRLHSMFVNSGPLRLVSERIGQTILGCESDALCSSKLEQIETSTLPSQELALDSGARNDWRR